MRHWEWQLLMTRHCSNVYRHHIGLSFKLMYMTMSIILYCRCVNRTLTKHLCQLFARDIWRNLIHGVELDQLMMCLVDLMRCGLISRILSSHSLLSGCLHLIWRKWSTWCSRSWLNAYAWFGSGARDILEVGWMPILDLRKQSTCSWNCLNAYTWFEKAKHVMVWKLVELLRLIWETRACDGLEAGWTPKTNLRKQSMWCSWSWSLGIELLSLKEFQSLRMFELKKLKSLLALGRILSRPSRVENFQPLQTRRTLLFIEFFGELYGLDLDWSMDQTHGPNHMDFCDI